MSGTVEEIAAKMDGLGLWDAFPPCHWAICPSGSVFPYFCAVLKGERAPVKVRFLLVEGWQTFHDFVRTRIDRNFGFYLTPMEMPHFELVILSTGEMKLFRHDPCFMPREANAAERKLCAKLLWEAYGVMLRIETDRGLPMKFAAEKAMFSRVEDAGGGWSDRALAIPDPRPYVENLRFAKDDLAKAKDLPFFADEAWELDFRLLVNVMTQEKRPRCVYELIAFDTETGERLVSDRISPVPDGGLKAMWESVPPRVLKHFLLRGRVPGAVRLLSGRLFRMLRPLCVDLPFKLSLCDSLPRLRD